MERQRILEQSPLAEFEYAQAEKLQEAKRTAKGIQKDPSRISMMRALFQNLKLEQPERNSTASVQMIGVIEDDILKNKLDFKDLGTTREEWQAFCRERIYITKAKTRYAQINSLLSREEEFGQNERKILVETECELMDGTITLSEIGINLDAWTQLCRKGNFVSIYRWYSMPTNLGKNFVNANFSLNKEYGLQILLNPFLNIDPSSGKVEPTARTQVFIIKRQNGGKQALLEEDIPIKEAVTPVFLIHRLRERFREQAMLIILTGQFIRRLVQ